MRSDPRSNVAELIVGTWKSHILYAGVKLGVFEALEYGQKEAMEITNQLSLDATLGYRLLRALASIGLLEERQERPARLGRDLGNFSFREWPFQWTPRRPGDYRLMVRAVNRAGESQADEPLWNPAGYMRNMIEHIDVRTA